MKLRPFFALCALAVAATAVAATATTENRLPAFPGAEGYGRYTTGGRGGNVYTVTNLDDSGQGSLRWALSQPGPRTIVFNVDGTIHLKSALGIPSNTTIAGQTAPGMGICVADYPFSLRGSNIIVRYMRIRLGNTNVQLDEADGWDGFGGYYSSLMEELWASVNLTEQHYWAESQQAKGGAVRLFFEPCMQQILLVCAGGDAALLPECPKCRSSAFFCASVSFGTASVSSRRRCLRRRRKRHSRVSRLCRHFRDHEIP